MKKNKISHIIDKYLNFVEKASNKLPDPFFLFLILSLIVILLSYLFFSMDVSAIHPADGSIVKVDNLLSKNNLQRIFTQMVDNFINFPPLGLVLASMLGIGIAEKSGFFGSALKHSILRMPDKFLVPAVCFISVNSSLIADAGNVVIPPLAGLLFAASGRHPIAGICASFSSVVGGFSANLAITALDPLLSELTMSAAQELDPSYEVYPTANYFFMITSVFVVTFVSTIVTNKIVIPRLGKWKGEIKKNDDLNENEVKALWLSYASVFLILALIFFGSVGENAFFKDQNGELSILYKSIIPLIIILFAVSGLVYGLLTKKIRRGKDVVNMMNESMSGMSVYLLLAFAAGQFLAFFNWSNLGIITAVKGADLIQSFDLNGMLVVFLFLIFAMILNIFIASASAKWTIIAPVFVPMMMLLGFSPELTQLIYRVADSTTNMITPLLPYFPLMIVFAQKFDKDISIGKLLSSLLPYSFALFISWSLMLFIWLILKLPIGPDAKLFYQ